MNYTGVQAGTKIGDQEVKVCPHCGKNGLAEDIEGKTYYLHGQTLAIGPEQIVEIKFVMCPKVGVQ